MCLNTISYNLLKAMQYVKIKLPQSASCNQSSARSVFGCYSQNSTAQACVKTTIRAYMGVCMQIGRRRRRRLQLATHTTRPHQRRQRQQQQHSLVGSRTHCSPPPPPPLSLASRDATATATATARVLVRSHSRTPSLSLARSLEAARARGGPRLHDYKHPHTRAPVHASGAAVCGRHTPRVLVAVALDLVPHGLLAEHCAAAAPTSRAPRHGDLVAPSRRGGGRSSHCKRPRCNQRQRARQLAPAACERKRTCCELAQEQRRRPRCCRAVDVACVLNDLGGAAAVPQLAHRLARRCRL